MTTENKLKESQLKLKKLRNSEQKAYLVYEAACDAQVAINKIVSDARIAFIVANEALRDFRGNGRD